MDARIFHLQKQILENPDCDWTIGQMAETVGLSVPHFQKLFKTNIGKPPIAYLQDLRLEKARELLEATFLQVQEVRNKVGILYDSHFTRDFKKKFGVTPTEYRKLFWEKKQAEEQDGKK